MGFRFGKSFKLGKGVRLNVSKKGLGMSVGVKGARIGIGPRGIRQTYSIPGTGISYTKQNSLKSKNTHNTYNSHANNFRTNEISKEYKSFYFQKQKTNENQWLILSIISLLFTFANVVFIIPLLIFGFLYYKTLKNPENNSKKLYNKALELFARKNFSSAIPFLQKSVEYFDSNISSHLLLAIIYHDQKQYVQAINHIDKYINQYSFDAMAKFIKADSLFETKEYELAIKLLQSFNFDNEEFEIKRTVLLGKCFFNSEKYEIAIEQFKKAPILKRNINEDILECKYWLGVSYYKIGDKSKAKTQLAKVYSENENYNEVKKYAIELGLI